MEEEKNVWWLKSKLFLTNLITTLISLFVLFIDEINSVFNNNLEFLRTVFEGKNLIILLVVVGLINTIAKTKKQQDKVTLKNPKKKKKSKKQVDTPEVEEA